MSTQQTSTSPPAPHQGGPRSEGLLPTDGPDENLEVAEEVSLDLQSDGTRRVGAMPPDTPVSKPAEAIARSLEPGDMLDDSPLRQAIERAVPPSDCPPTRPA